MKVEIVNPQSGRTSQMTIAFTVSFKGRSPEVSRNIVDELVDLYMLENKKSRAETNTETTDFFTR